MARNVRLLIADKLLAFEVGEDRRERLLALTKRGRSRYDEAQRLWASAQAKLVKEFGLNRFAQLLWDLSTIVPVKE